MQKYDVALKSLRGPASAGDVLAILGRGKSPERTVREVLNRIAQLPPD